MSHKSVIIKLYHLLVLADGKVNEREVSSGRLMTKIEGISDSEFASALDALKKRNAAVVYSECLEELKKLSRDKQIRCLAWLSVIANADGFMDKAEWQFIYKIYHTELGLKLDEILKAQRELNGLKEKAVVVPGN